MLAMWVSRLINSPLHDLYWSMKSVDVKTVNKKLERI
jgi:hypothetical protein